MANKCQFDPSKLTGTPVGMYCPICLRIVFAGMEHPDYSEEKEEEETEEEENDVNTT